MAQSFRGSLGVQVGYVDAGISVRYRNKDLLTQIFIL